MLSDADIALINDLWHEGHDFALCRLPSQDKLIQLNGDNFIVNPFPSQYQSTCKTDYITGLTQLIGELKKTGGKTVIARTISGIMTRDLGIVANEFFSQNPRALCLVARINGDGWIAASPELLLDVNLDTGHFKTMALAGTREADNTDEWDNKNAKEQQYVTDFIVDITHDLGLKIDSLKTETLKSNNIAHICTNIQGSGLTKQMIAPLLDNLSPTPALCGTPRDRALQHIAQYEPTPRKLYGGYFGISTDSRVLIYVMLRCATINSSGQFTIYTGSGITALSDPIAEYRETALKARPLLMALSRRNHD